MRMLGEHRVSVMISAPAVLVWACLLIFMALSPQRQSFLATGVTAGALSARLSDAGLHLLGLGLLAGLLWVIIRPVARPLVAAAVAWLGATGFGLVMELLQHRLTGRSAELKDLLADMSGAALAVLLCLAATRAADAIRAMTASANPHIRGDTE